MRRILLGFGLAMLCSLGVPAPPRGFELIATRTLDAEERAELRSGVQHPIEPVFVTDEQGWPLQSSAGFLRPKVSGPGFVVASELPGFRNRPDTEAQVGRVEWGDREVFRALHGITRDWHDLHPDGPRLVIGDISHPDGGFGDFNADGLSDHLTHQLGTNLNIHLPGRGDPEPDIHLGRRDDELYDPTLGRQLLETVFRHGASSVTTTRGTRAFAVQEGIGLPIEKSVRMSDAAEMFFLKGSGQVLILLEPITNHGDHANVWFVVDR